MAEWTKIKTIESQMPELSGYAMCSRNPVNSNDQSEIYIYGGINAESKTLNNVFLLDLDKFTTEVKPSEPQVKKTGSFPEPRERHTLTTIQRDVAVLFGGFNSEKILGDTWILYLHPFNIEWMKPKTESTETPSERYNHSASYIGKDKMIIFGGYDGFTYLNDLWTVRLYLKNKEYYLEYKNIAGSKLSENSPCPRFQHSMCFVDNKVYLFGGKSHDKRLNDLWFLDIEKFTWKKVKTFGIPPSPRYGHIMISMAGDIFVFGGYSPNFSKPEESFPKDVFRFRSLTSEWSLEKRELDYVPKTPEGRMNFSCILSSTGRAFLFGGITAEKEGLVRINDFWTFEVEALDNSKRATFGSFIVKKPIISELLYGDLYNVIHEKRQGEFILRRLKTIESNVDIVMQEIEQFKKLTHENLQPIDSTFLDKRYGDCSLIILRNKTNGGTLEEYMKQNKKKFNEMDILKLAIQVVKGVDFLHSNSITHRDLKLNTILIEVVDKLPVVKISEYGFSSLHLTHNDVPEYIDQSTNEIDIWYLGFILYYIFYFDHLSFNQKNPGETIKEIQRSIVDRNYKFGDQYIKLIIQCFQVTMRQLTTESLIESLEKVSTSLIELNEPFVKPDFDDDIVSASLFIQSKQKKIEIIEEVETDGFDENDLFSQISSSSILTNLGSNTKLNSFKDFKDREKMKYNSPTISPLYKKSIFQSMPTDPIEVPTFKKYDGSPTVIKKEGSLNLIQKEGSSNSIKKEEKVETPKRSRNRETILKTPERRQTN